MTCRPHPSRGRSATSPWCSSRAASCTSACGRGDDGTAVLLVGHLRGERILPRHLLLDVAASLFKLVPGIDPATTAYVELHTGDRDDREKYTLREVTFQIPDISAPEGLEM